jgi:hypothetical protein
MLTAYLAGLVEALAGCGERVNSSMRRTARVVQNLAPIFPRTLTSRLMENDALKGSAALIHINRGDKTLARSARVKPRGLRDPKVSLAIGMIVVVVAGLFFYLQYLPTYQGQSQGLAIDWRVRLHILDARFGTNSTPPGGIGTPGGIWSNHTYDALNGTWLGPPGYASMYTRDSSGTIYIQSTVCCPAYVFTMGYFFSEWGQHLTSSCIGTYCTSPGESLVYDNNTNGKYDTGELIYAAGNIIPPVNTLLSSDPALRFFDRNGNGVWNSSKPIVYDVDGDGIYNAGDVVVWSTAPPLGSHLSSDPKIKFVDSIGNGRYVVPQPPPAMSDGTERCVDPNIKLSNGKDWLIIIWSSLGRNLGCK